MQEAFGFSCLPAPPGLVLDQISEVVLFCYKDAEARQLDL